MSGSDDGDARKIVEATRVRVRQLSLSQTIARWKAEVEKKFREGKVIPI
jgi:hypothetical protein